MVTKYIASLAQFKFRKRADDIRYLLLNSNGILIGELYFFYKFNLFIKLLQDIFLGINVNNYFYFYISEFICAASLCC